jgi:hypothetical protein
MMKRLYVFRSQVFIFRGNSCDNSSPTAIVSKQGALHLGLVEGLIDTELLSTQRCIFIYCCWPTVQ